MSEIESKMKSILVVGSDKLAYSIAVCLLDAGEHVTLYSEKEASAIECINAHFSDIYKREYDVLAMDNFVLVSQLGREGNYSLSIVITKENLSHKQNVIQKLERILPGEMPIAINTESIPLSAIQQDAIHPKRIIGANWVEPAHTTYFLEVLSNQRNEKGLANNFSVIAKQFWGKDPYVLHTDTGIRSRLMSALVREAFYLVENGYVTVEDIDRACRNDPGYYLPYAGNCRYIDLMGTYIYGVVMKDLNPELSKDTHIPSFFEEIINKGEKGMENGKGFYSYEGDTVNEYHQLFRKFSYQIKKLISKYSFKKRDRTTMVEDKKF